MYDSFLRISRALHLDVFDQPGENHFFSNLLVQGLWDRDFYGTRNSALI